MAIDVLDYSSAVHDFMRASVPLDDAGMAKLVELATYTRDGDKAKNSASFCLNSAVTYAQADKLPVLVDRFNANVQQYPKLMSDRHPGQPYISNLLEEALSSYHLRPDVDRSPEGRARLLATVEFLLQRGVSAAPNADPIEGAVAYAYLLAHPGEYGDVSSPLCDPWGLAIGEECEPPFTEPYELIRQYQPEAVKAFEAALAIEREKMAQDMREHPEKYDVSELLEIKSGAQQQPLWRQIAHAIAPKWF